MNIFFLSENESTTGAWSNGSEYVLNKTSAIGFSHDVKRVHKKNIQKKSAKDFRILFCEDKYRGCTIHKYPPPDVFRIQMDFSKNTERAFTQKISSYFFLSHFFSNMGYLCCQGSILIFLKFVLNFYTKEEIKYNSTQLNRTISL